MTWLSLSCQRELTSLFFFSIAVKDEFDGVTNDDVLWATLGFCILSLVALCVLIGLSCFNEFAEPDLTIFGSAGMFICCGTACK